MVIGIIGESCVGKTKFSSQLCDHLSATVYTGKDFLRLAKNENEAKHTFQDKLEQAAASKVEHIIYLISEREHISLLPQNALRILMTADLEIIKQRFAIRMHGNLPEPVAKMLEKKHGIFDQEPHCLHIISGETDLNEACEKVLNLINCAGDVGAK